VVVPAAAGSDQPTAFEGTAIERSIAALEAPRPAKPGGIFAAESFEIPSAGDVDEAVEIGDPTDGITLSRRAIYAYAMMIPAIAAAAFWLGCWWTSTGGR
jgi:hypothetical protein